MPRTAFHSHRFVSKGLIPLAFVSLLSCLSSFPAGAQEPSPAGAKYTLSELVSLALKSTPLLAAQDARMSERRHATDQARAWAGPSLGVSAGRTKQVDVSGSRVELSVAQPLPLTGLPALRGKLGEVAIESLAVEREAAQVAVTLAVAQGAYEYAAGRRKVAFAETRRKRFELIQSYLAGRVFPTPQRKAESRIVSNRVKNVVAEAILSGAGYKAAFEKLKVYAPLDPGRYPEVAVPWLSGARGLDEKEWLDRALAGNPELRARRLAVQGAGFEAALASREGLPDTAVVASYETGKEEIVGRSYGLGLSLGLPFWNRNRSGIKSAEQRTLAEERLLAFSEARLKAELSRALVEYEAARQVVLKYPEAMLPDFEEQLREADEDFKKGQVDLLTFLELDGSAAETYARALDAQVELAAKAAELLALAADRDALAKLGSF